MTTEEPILRWEDPPSARTGPGRPRDPDSKTRRIATALMSRPGQWGVIREGEIAVIRNAKGKYHSGAYPAFTPVDQWEFCTRVKPQDTYVAVLYGRYVGPHPNADET